MGIFSYTIVDCCRRQQSKHHKQCSQSHVKHDLMCKSEFWAPEEIYDYFFFVAVLFVSLSLLFVVATFGIGLYPVQSRGFRRCRLPPWWGRRSSSPKSCRSRFWFACQKKRCENCECRRHDVRMIWCGLHAHRMMHVFPRCSSLLLLLINQNRKGLSQ